MFLIKDKKGFISLIDSLLAIFMVFILLGAACFVLNLDSFSLSKEKENIKTGQDIMEIFSSKIDGRDYSLMEKVSYILYSNNNSIQSKREVGEIMDDFFKIYLINSNGVNSGGNGGVSINNENIYYSFVFDDGKDNGVLSSNGDYLSANDMNVAIRYYNNYSYKLYTFY